MAETSAVPSTSAAMPESKTSSKTVAAPRMGSLRFVAVVLLVTSMCGAVAAVFVFYHMGNAEQSTAVHASLAASLNQEALASESKSKSEVKAKTETETSCEDMYCKVGGDEVCGNDGKTYLNECYFQKVQCGRSTLSKVEDWNGYNCPNTCTKSISCSEVGKFLCGSDGNVYFGYCKFYIAQCLDESLTEVPCDKSIFDGFF